MERNIRSLLILLILSIAVSFSSAEAKDRGKFLFEETLTLYKSLVSNPEKSKKKEIWDVIGESFYSVYISYPNSSKAPNSLFLAGKVYEEIGNRFNSYEDKNKAIKYSKEFVLIYPNSNLTDDSQLRVARILEKRGNKTDAYNAYYKIVYQLPKDDMYAPAKRKLDQLKKYKPSKTVAKKTTSGKKGRITKIRHWSTDNYTRVVIHVDKSMGYKSNFLRADPKKGKPPRLYVDIQDAEVDNTLYVEPITKGLLSQIKFGRNQPDTSRVVLYINSFENYKVFSLNEPYRIVMYIKGTGANPDKIFSGHGSGTGSGTGNKDPCEYTYKPPAGGVDSLKAALGLKIKTVVIDPGHGGHDPGAIGPSGLKEKDVNLRIAKTLKEKLIRDGKKFGIEKVHLTRSTDKFIPLEERTAIAKKLNADLFISIHCNAAKDRRAHGIETYILSFTNDKSSLEVAARENATTTKRLSDLEDIVQKYLLSSKIEESNRFAKYVQGSIVTNVSAKYSKVKNKGVKKAPFIVLIGADIPSILIETSFISNPTEESRLKSSGYISKIADGIVTGIKKYVGENQTAQVTSYDEYKL